MSKSSKSSSSSSPTPASTSVTPSTLPLSRPSHVPTSDWSQLTSALSTHGFDSGVPLSALQSATDKDLGNDLQVEIQWAEKAGKHAETYQTVLGMMENKKKVRLTAMDDEIYTHFRSVFPTLDVNNIDENIMKSDGAKGGMKDQWRIFCSLYEKEEKVNDYNFGTLLRVRSAEEYAENNSTVVPRIQFLAIEIARNREGGNDWIKKEKKEEKGK